MLEFNGHRSDLNPQSLVVGGYVHRNVSLPFLFWVKDEEWRYLWGNQAICDFAGEDVVGKSDRELKWKADAKGLVQNDQEVLASGQAHYYHEHVAHSELGDAMLSVCKWVDELEGRKLVFGVSFVIPGGK